MTCQENSCTIAEYMWSIAAIIILSLLMLPIGRWLWFVWGPSDKKRFIDIFTIFASITGIAILILAVVSDGDSKYTRFGPGPDVYFGGWQLDTWLEYGGWFMITLLIGIVDVVHYDNVGTFFMQIYQGKKLKDTWNQYIDYKYGNKYDTSRLFWQMQFIFLFMQLRLIIDVLIINTQIWPILARQFIKEILIGRMNYFRLKDSITDEAQAVESLIDGDIDKSTKMYSLSSRAKNRRNFKF